ncbi:MAG: hypothetical protein QOF47_1282 [Mycobacterium sp.]|jgi:hypothetical protein|nr:hypothetical protein [Mycobacterium sp.]MDT5333980.1 hypothetical protein [Mycobacterium sp.]
MSNNDNAVVVHGRRKSFGAAVALRDISFTAADIACACTIPTAFGYRKASMHE